MAHIMQIRVEMPDGRIAEGYVQRPERTGLALTSDINRAYPFPSMEAAQEYAAFVHKNKPPKVAETRCPISYDVE